MKAAYTALAPALIVGGAWTLLLSGVGWYSGLCLLTGIVWAICYGLALLATSHFAPRSLTLLGWAFLMAGIAALLCVRLKPGVIDETSRPGILFLAATFGLFHLIYAACAWPRRGAAHEL
jgi:hypothetical protein